MSAKKSGNWAKKSGARYPPPPPSPFSSSSYTPQSPESRADSPSSSEDEGVQPQVPLPPPIRYLVDNPPQGPRAPAAPFQAPFLNLPPPSPFPRPQVQPQPVPRAFAAPVGHQAVPNQGQWPMPRDRAFIRNMLFPEFGGRLPAPRTLPQVGVLPGPNWISEEEETPTGKN